MTTLQCFQVVIIVLSSSSTLAFSRGASLTSCQEMTPGHIRAQPQDPRRSHVTLRASASSYLPGQLVTVTVRSSRDFMGFLVQARGVEGTGVGVKARTGSRSTRVGPVLMGGSWTLTPPGTHTLRCLSEGDTLTHSDKQLKRNLSFGWRAPDTPLGDIQFHITVVQSYFVYWAGIQSAVVRDGSRSPWSGSNITGVKGGNSVMRQQEVTALPALRPSTKRTNVGPGTTPGPSGPTSGGTQSYAAQQTPTQANPALALNSSTSSVSLTNHKKDTYGTSGSLSDVAEGKGSPVSHTGDPDSSFFPSNHRPFTAFHSEMEATSSLFLNITAKNSTSQEINFQNPKLSTIPETNGTTLNPETTATDKPSSNLSFLNTNPLKPTSQSPKETIQDQPGSVQSSSSQPWRTSLTESQRSQVKDQMGSQSLLQIPQTSPSKLIVYTQKGKRQTFALSQTSSLNPFFNSQTSSPNLILQSKSPKLQSFLKSHMTSSLQPFPNKPTPESSPSGPTARPRPTSPPQTQTTEPLTRTMTTQTPNSSDQSTSHIPPEALSISLASWSQHHQQTSTRSTHTFGWRQTPSINPLPFTSRVTLGKNVKALQSQSKFETLWPISASIPSTKSFPSISLHSSSFPSSHVFLTSSLVPPTTPLHPSGGLSKQTSFTFGSLLSSSVKNQPKTPPSLSALPFPSPISIPPSSFTSPTTPSSNYPSPAPLFSSVSLTSFTSQPTTGSTIPSSISSASPPSNLSSSSASSWSISPHPGPSPAPRRSLYNPLTSTSSPEPSQDITPGHRLPIQNHIASPDPVPKINLPTLGTVVHPNPGRQPNRKPNGQESKPNLPKTESKLPSNPVGAPGKEGKYPDIIPRHTAWELGMLLGCSAGLGTVLVVGVRYVYRQACGKRTEVTLNDREREYGLLHVQECGDLVRVRRIRENSFVVLAEYDILASPGD